MEEYNRFEEFSHYMKKLEFFTANGIEDMPENTGRKFIFLSFIGINRDIGPAVRVFANGPGDMGSIPGRVIPKTLKMVLDTTLLNTQHYKVRFKGKVEQSWEWSSALPYTLV